MNIKIATTFLKPLCRAKFLAGFLLCLSAATSLARLADTSDDLQAILDAGEDLQLKKSAVYEIKAPLKIKKAGQKIYTQNANCLADYATLKLVSTDSARILDMSKIPQAEVRNVLFDGNKYLRHDGSKRESLVQAGSWGGDFQKIVNCAFINGRGWSLLHIFEPAKGTEISGCFFFGSGSDCRGGGACLDDKPFPWGDAISLASADSKVFNNLIVDPTDVGIVIFCAPNSKVQKNVIAAISREALGAVNMVDAIAFYENPKESNRFDYSGVLVAENLADAKGARIHIAYPVGKHIWGPGSNAGRSGKIVYGAKILNNEISGNCMGYGIALHGAQDIEVKGNRSSAFYSRAGDGMHHVRTAYPDAFIFDEKTVKDCDLQSEFKAGKLNMVHLLACNFGERTEQGNGFRLYQYGASEALGVVNCAYYEMLGRLPKADELCQGILLLDSQKLSADALRLKIASSKEFKDKFGNIDAQNLHIFRAKKWLSALDKVQRLYLKKYKRLPEAKEAYEAIWQSFAK